MFPLNYVFKITILLVNVKTRSFDIIYKNYVKITLIFNMEMFLGVIILIIAVAGMSVGVIFNRKPISGSCGGLSSSGNCSICGNDTEKCENKFDTETNLT